jgi:outer membrane putative beta-barrel porin/alpha-amylase
LTIAIGILLTAAAPALAEDPWWSISGLVDYSVGDYGTGTDTHLLYIPFTLGVSPIDRLTLSGTIPYIWQDTQTVTLTGGGVAVRKKKERQLATAPSSVTHTESGLGDILFKGQYVLLEEQDLVPEVSPYLKIKFPTADSDKGLGTGEFDETLGVDFTKTFFERLVGYVTLAYTFIGSPPGEDLHNSFFWSVGAAYRVIQPLSVFTFLEGATAIAPGEADPLEIVFGAEYKLTKALKLTGSVGKGLSNGSPDWEITGGFTVRF